MILDILFFACCRVPLFWKSPKRLGHLCQANHFKLNHGMGSNLMSSLVLAPIGLKEVELTEYLQKDLGVDVWNPRQMTRADS